MQDHTPSQHPVRQLLGLATLAMLVIVLVGCSRVVGPRSLAMSAVTTAGETWSVHVNDTSGLVTNATVDPTPLFVDATGLPFNPPGQAETVVIPWTGGACDRVTTFNISSRDGGGLAVDYRTEVAPGACDAIGVLHQLVLTTSPAMPAGRVAITRQP